MEQQVVTTVAQVTVVLKVRSLAQELPHAMNVAGKKKMCLNARFQYRLTNITWKCARAGD